MNSPFPCFQIVGKNYTVPLFLFPATGRHFKGPLALHHSFSTALPIYSLSNLYYYTLNNYKCLSTALLQSFAKHLSDLIPADLIGREMNSKALSVPCINSCILWFIGVIYHTILSVFHIGMNFHIIIRREPAVKFILCRCRPEHGSVQNTTVFKAVRQTADINATTPFRRFLPPSGLPGLSGSGSSYPAVQRYSFLPSPKSTVPSVSSRIK